MRPTDGRRPARVVSVGRNAAWIAFEDEERVRLAAFRKNVERLALVPGDVVSATPLDDERVVIDGREPRTFALERTTAGGRTRTMAANIDGIAVVAALARPPLHQAMIDELLAFAAIFELEARLIFTKADLAEDPGEVEAIVALYRGLGYEVLLANPRLREGVPAIEAAFAGRCTLLIGQSGVGKSSLFGALGGRADVGDVSKTGRGKQTTTTGRLHRFAAGGFLIDSPGVGDFALQDCTPPQVALGFVEFAARAPACRFSDCTHRSEPGCGILAKVESGAIARERYESYRAILDRGLTA
ncbi:MAG: ribosome small subunit-dependent GTPase A [Candidatus Eremiobacteraeota bacterium]|nr:ribosome small subunit-dependent GTPase A [Candidatus Eremiobacteraeota bacterium]